MTTRGPTVLGDRGGGGGGGVLEKNHKIGWHPFSNIFLTCGHIFAVNKRFFLGEFKPLICLNHFSLSKNDRKKTDRGSGQKSENSIELLDGSLVVKIGGPRCVNSKI